MELIKEVTRLKKKIQPLEEFNVDYLNSVRKEMEDFLFKNKYGVGLAAPQVGLELPVAIVLENGKKPVFLINPEIHWTSEQIEWKNEGCLSFPNIEIFHVPRYQSVEVRAKSINRDKLYDYNVKYVKLNARVAQHEIDHLNGLEMFDRVYENTEIKIPKNPKLYDMVYKNGDTVFCEGIDLYTGEQVNHNIEESKLIGIKWKR